MSVKIITIEGLDGSGKETQSRLLYNSMINENIKAQYVSFPNYDSKSSEFVKMYLNGEISSNMNDVNAYAASTFFACDRYITFLTGKEKFFGDNDFLICDRYTTSNKIYQMAKLKENDWDIFYDWLEDFEHKKLCLPKADLVIYLKVPVKVSSKLIDKRCAINNCKKDVYEKNIDFLNTCSNVAEYISNKENWEVIDCMGNDGEIQSIEYISGCIAKIVNNKFGIFI